MKYFVNTLNEADFEKAEIAKVNEYVWGRDYTPDTEARVVYVKDKGLYLKMTSRESGVRAHCRTFYGDVFHDSCMEWFFGFEKGGNYINCEINPIAVSHIGVGASRSPRKPITDFCPMPDIRAAVGGGEWSVSASFPLESLRAVFGDISLDPGSVFYGNFYKCGEKTANPHYGMWSKIDWATPDFHRPEFFGEFEVR